jgi:prevent-host-death family protein
VGTIASFEAETHFAELLDRVEGGESITITRSGRPVAVLTPVASSVGGKRERRDVIRDLLEFGKGRKLEGETLRSMIEEGRRF